ncbi:MAG: carbohydrate ABC transporter substrate-binding protein [Cellulosilyticaceae bacterium]
MKKKFIAALLTSALAASAFTGCAAKEATPAPEVKAEETKTEAKEEPAPATPEDQILNIAVFEGGYGRAYWDAIAVEFEKANPGVKVVIEANPEIGEIIRPKLLSGDAPDFIYLPSTNGSGIANALVKDKLLADITDVFEDPAIKDKILPGFLDGTAAQPYGDGKIYLAPLYYSSTGLFYNADTFEKNGWDVPVTWDEFFALGDKAKEVGKSLITYQGLHPGYMEAMLIPAMVSSVGPEGFDKASAYEEGAWEQQGIIDAMKKIEDIQKGGYLMNGTVALDHTQSQSQWLLGNALFIPCGSWLEGEMADAPREEGFKWGFTASPVFNVDDEKYTLTVVEEMYIPAASDQVDLAKEFLKFQYTDVAVALNAELAKGIPPVKGAADVITPFVEEATAATYQVYEDGYNPYVLRFATVEGTEVNPKDELFNNVTTVMNGEMTAEEWSAHMEKVSDSVRDSVVK